VEWLYLVYDKAQWPAPVNTVRKLRVA